jgi:ribonuclease P/MRP protein subunit POP8
LLLFWKFDYWCVGKTRDRRCKADVKIRGVKAETHSNLPPTNKATNGPQFFPAHLIMANDSDTSMADAPVASMQQKQQKTSKGHEITTQTIKTPPFSYACLELVSKSTAQIQLDDLTVRSYITAALTQFLGLTGSAISVDLLKVEGRECWIRVPREDLSPLTAALGGWICESDGHGRVGWLVKASGNWLSSLVGNHGVEKIWGV